MVGDPSTVATVLTQYSVVQYRVKVHPLRSFRLCVRFPQRVHHTLLLRVRIVVRASWVSIS